MPIERKRLKDPPKAGKPPKPKERVRGPNDAWPESRPRPEPVPITGSRTKPVGSKTTMRRPNVKAKPGSLYERRELVIANLLKHPSIPAAAQASGVSAATIRVWFRTEEFQEQYKQARQQVLELAISTTASHVNEAVATLVRNLTCGRSDSEIRAAAVILQWAGKFLPEQFRDQAGAKIANAAMNGQSTIIVVDGTEDEYVEGLNQVAQ